MNLATSFARVAAHRAAQTAVFWGDEKISYAQLLHQARSVAGRLVNEFHVKPGDRVGLWLRNCPEFVTALFGILEAGGVVVPINNFLKPDEVDYILKDAGIKVLISEHEPAHSQAKLASGPAGLRFLCVEDFPRMREQFAAASIPHGRAAAESLAVIIYTSGTTGHPKGAMLSHANLLHNVESCRQVLEVVKEDRFVAVLPMFHSFMLTVCVLLPLLVGGSIVLVKSVHPAKNVVQEILRHKASILPAVPPFFRALLQSELPAGFPLRVCISGGAALPVQLLQDFNASMPVPLVEGYGLSEASPVVSINPIKGLQKPGSIGLPIPDVEMSIQDDHGRVLGAGRTGEVCVRGGNVMLGYWRQPGETRHALRQGWLLTGDIGHRDADGYYFITDRKKDMLIVNGNNVYPREIEEAIYQLPSIKEAAVIGVPDARKGEQPVGFVSAKEGASIEVREIIRHLRHKLADYKVPRKILVLPELPRNATGKILKTALRKMV